MLGSKRQLALTSAIAITIALSISVGVYYAGPSLQSGTAGSFSSYFSTVTTYTISEPNMSYYPFQAPNSTTLANLRLEASLSLITVNGQQSVLVTMNETNISNSFLNITANQQWWSDTSGGIGDSVPGENNFPIKVNLLSGYHTSSNISNYWYWSWYPPDPAIWQTSVEYYGFKPSSYSADMIQYPGRQCCGTFSNLSASYELLLQGCCYYSSPGNYTSFALAKGVYTVEIYDMWGRTILAYFTVSQTFKITPTSSNISNYGAVTTTTTGIYHSSA